MLGITAEKKPITGEFAKQVREQLARAKKCILTQEERVVRTRQKESQKKYQSVWK